MFTENLRNKVALGFRISKLILVIQLFEGNST
jgi:hypothetical protein